MPELKNETTVAAPRSVVRQAVTNLGALPDYDPGVNTDSFVGELTSGLGARDFLTGLKQRIEHVRV